MDVGRRAWARAVREEGETDASPSPARHKNSQKFNKKDLTNSQICGPGNLARALVNMHKKEVITHFPFVTILISDSLYRLSNTQPQPHL
jgi:hypothetical protein